MFLPPTSACVDLSSTLDLLKSLALPILSFGWTNAFDVSTASTLASPLGHERCLLIAQNVGRVVSFVAALWLIIIADVRVNASSTLQSVQQLVNAYIAELYVLAYW
jgi:hypothetical protein